MEELTQLFIHTQWRAQSHKWDVNEQGLVSYNDQLMAPREVYERFIVDFPMFNVIRVEVCRRIPNPDPNAERPYLWISLERFA